MTKPDRGEGEQRPSSNGNGDGNGRATGEPGGREEFVARPMDPADSPGWFGYIAVGIALVSMLVGLVVAGWMLYALVHRLMRTG